MPEAPLRHVFVFGTLRRGGRNDINRRASRATSSIFKRELAVEVEGRQVRCLVYEINPERVHGRQALAHGDWILFRPA